MSFSRINKLKEMSKCWFRCLTDECGCVFVDGVGSRGDHLGSYLGVCILQWFCIKFYQEEIAV